MRVLYLHSLIGCIEVVGGDGLLWCVFVFWEGDCLLGTLFNSTILRERDRVCVCVLVCLCVFSPSIFRSVPRYRT